MNKLLLFIMILLIGCMSSQGKSESKDLGAPLKCVNGGCAGELNSKDSIAYGKLLVCSKCNYRYHFSNDFWVIDTENKDDVIIRNDKHVNKLESSIDGLNFVKLKQIIHQDNVKESFYYTASLELDDILKNIGNYFKLLGLSVVNTEDYNLAKTVGDFRFIFFYNDSQFTIQMKKNQANFYSFDFFVESSDLKSENHIIEKAAFFNKEEF